jgi:hypothetical protein
LEPENWIGGQFTIRKQPEMADRPPGQRSLFAFGVMRVAEKRPPHEVDQAEVERDVEAKRQARKQCEQDAAAAAAVAKRPVGRPEGSGKKLAAEKAFTLKIPPGNRAPSHGCKTTTTTAARAGRGGPAQWRAGGVKKPAGGRAHRRKMMRWDDVWDSDPRRASKPFWETVETHWWPQVNHLRKPRKLDPLPVKSLELKFVWSPTVLPFGRPPASGAAT